MAAAGRRPSHSGSRGRARGRSPGTALLAAASLWLVACPLLPERYAMNAPLGNLLFNWSYGAPDAATVESRLRVPPGFRIGLFAEDLPNARVLLVTGAGDLLVSLPRSGRVVRLLPDRDGDGRSDGRSELLTGLEGPHGLDLHDGWLYVGERVAVGRVRFDAGTGETRGAYERIVPGLPGDGNHWTKTVRMGPDGWLYVSIGSSCNVCEEADPRRAALLRYRPDGSGGEPFATGLRNAVGFDWQPGSGDLYATDNGRDLLGDDFPPCELNRVVGGGFYGWPYANGDNRPDPDLGAGHEARIAGALPPAHSFRAHNAPLGIRFVRSPAAPAALRGAALVALHGSWNRTAKDGYKVVSLHFGPGDVVEERDFAWGFELDDDVIGRPADVAPAADGSVYVSDDYAGAVYRVVAGDGPAPAGAATTPEPARPHPLAALASSERDELSRRGRALYERHGCFGCHEPGRAEPGVQARPLQGLAGRFGLDSLQAFLAAPTPPMPRAPLSDAERRELSVFLLSR